MSEEKILETAEYKPSKALSTVFEWMSAAVTALVLLALVFACLFRMVKVEGQSMEPTLQNSDQMLLSSLPYNNPEFGDIVVITGVHTDPLIKRVIGVPGDTIYIDPVNGDVYRNDVILDEPYIRETFIGKTKDGQTKMGTPAYRLSERFTVPEDAVFVMGDNRGASLDSRQIYEYKNGCIPLKHVVGKVLYRVSPNGGSIYKE